MIRLTVFAILLATASVLLTDEKPGKNESKEMHGIWSVVESEAKGEKIELPWVWTFKPDGKANLVDRKAGKQSLFRCKADTSVAPHRMELVYLGPDAALKDYRQLAIWKVEAEKLMLNLNPPNVDRYPEDFESDKGFSLVLEKVSVE